MLDKFLMGETPDRGITIVGCNIPCRLSSRTEVRGRFHPPHLQQGGEDKCDWHTLLLQEDICEVVFFPGLTIHTPKAIVDVPLCHENIVVVIGLGKGMNYATRGMT